MHICGCLLVESKPWGPFLESHGNISGSQSHCKISNLAITELLFHHIFQRWRMVPFIQDVSGVYTFPFLDTDDLKMALRARKLSGAFEKRALARKEATRVAKASSWLFFVNISILVGLLCFVLVSLVLFQIQFVYCHIFFPEGKSDVRMLWSSGWE